MSKAIAIKLLQDWIDRGKIYNHRPGISDLAVIMKELEEPDASNISPQDCCP
jgi:hypothetical protein